MASYSYDECLRASHKASWRIEQVLGEDRFGRGRCWLPPQLSGAGAISCLSAAEQLQLTHVEMGAYAHLFGFVEEFIAPQMVNLARECELDDRAAFDALTNFAAEEVKHMHLFRQVRALVDDALGFPLRLLDGQREIARAVLGKSPGAVLLLTSAIEWLTQAHYVDAMKDSDALDPLAKTIFRYHWMEEAQHARLDHLETVRSFGKMSASQRDEAIEQLVELVAAVDALLQRQTDLDVANLAAYLGRAFTSAEEGELRRSVLRAKRHAFIESGVAHPNFQELFAQVTTPAQRDHVQERLGRLLGPPTIH